MFCCYSKFCRVKKVAHCFTSVRRTEVKFWATDLFHFTKFWNSKLKHKYTCWTENFESVYLKFPLFISSVFFFNASGQNRCSFVSRCNWYWAFHFYFNNSLWRKEKSILTISNSVNNTFSLPYNVASSIDYKKSVNLTSFSSNWCPHQIPRKTELFLEIKW